MASKPLRRAHNADFGLCLGILFCLFWVPGAKVKIELSLESEPHFHSPKAPGSHVFFDTFSKTAWGHPLEARFPYFARFSGRPKLPERA